MPSEFATKIFADGAEIDEIVALAADRRISGFTTNPTLMHKAGITDYEAFARSLLDVITTHPISFEVFADDAPGMREQARVINSWGPNVYVKIPITNTDGTSMKDVVRDLSLDGVKINVTAVFTMQQVESMAEALLGGSPAYVSIFAGRIADAGVDPVPIVRDAVKLLSPLESVECLWASPREVLNYVQAQVLGCHIITMTTDLLRKLDGLGKDLTEFSLETVRMFRTDALSAGFKISG